MFVLNRKQRIALAKLNAIGPSDAPVNVRAAALAVASLSHLQIGNVNKDFRKTVEETIRPGVISKFEEINRLAPLDFTTGIEMAINIIKSKHAMVYAESVYRPSYNSNTPIAWIYGGMSYFTEADHELLGTKTGYRLTQIYIEFLTEEE